MKGLFKSRKGRFALAGLLALALVAVSPSYMLFPGGEPAINAVQM